MGITKEFIQQELDNLEQELVRTREHLLKVDGALTVYRLLLTKIDEPEPISVEEKGDEP